MARVGPRRNMSTADKGALAGNTRLRCLLSASSQLPMQMMNNWLMRGTKLRKFIRITSVDFENWWLFFLISFKNYALEVKILKMNYFEFVIYWASIIVVINATPMIGNPLYYKIRLSDKGKHVAMWGGWGHQSLQSKPFGHFQQICSNIYFQLVWWYDTNGYQNHYPYLWSPSSSSPSWWWLYSCESYRVTSTSEC